MFTIKKDQENKSRIIIDTIGKYPISNWSIPFTHVCNSQLEADLLVENLTSKLQSLIQEVKVDAYSKGYADGRKKTSKKTWHSCLFKADSSD